MPATAPPKTAKLALADGTVYTGHAFGADGEIDGEVVFNTSMTGYQEILTDPSYCGQIVTMTYPQIGNYGINPEDVESGGLKLRGFVCRELCRRPSNYRSTTTLDDYLREQGIMGIEGIDTRSLVRRIRTHGAMNGILSTVDLDDESLVAKASGSASIVGRDLVREVVPKASYGWDEPLSPLGRRIVSTADTETGDAASTGDAAVTNDGPLVVAVDYGMKWNIPRHLRERGCRVEVVPGGASAAEILERNPAGVFLSNGPGDPEPLTYAIDTIREVIQHKPTFGICLGQQLLGLALGGETFKLKFGHRGANQPVRDERTGKIEITSQNHGFAIDPESLPDAVEVTHVNLNDGTVEGIRHRELPVFGVQYHPEASAGPHDSSYLFDEFRAMLS